jgi:antirestriction protein ArdC
VVKNAVTGVAYQGGNIAKLEAAEAGNNFDPGEGWAGFKQWLTAGRVVRRGEHGTACLRVLVSTDKKTGLERKTAKGFRVFHFDQTEVLVAQEVAA